MIATAKKPIEFNSALKNRAAEYWRAHPNGNYEHFFDTWRRAAQVKKAVFNEVQLSLQKNGELPVADGSRSYDILMKEMEKKIRKEYEGVETPAPLSIAGPGPDNMPETQVTPQIQTPEEKEDEMAKEFYWSELSDEQKAQVDNALRGNPEMEYEALNKILGLALKKTVFWGIKTKIRNGSYPFKFALVPARLPGKTHRGAYKIKSRMAHIAEPEAPKFVGNPALNPDMQVKNPIIMGETIDCESWTKEERVFLRKNLPTILATLIGRRMEFQVVQYTIDEDDKETFKLEVRRIK